ncbi:thiamine pyrophosphate-binding protein [Cetobacterium sp. 2A]|uniref:thiamine pyrophosphate-binding protein n=1 Tax=Cetobacterium sp. 2A TaxID=2754723 RepID=UPI00163C00F7|nr:thiamine pyrophosphate-binding protein [Cetobacterium sp. 2A]MBC2856156.1 thiamine pyrophosphate-binding protein [Cetobacterium sp. 2A]
MKVSDYIVKFFEDKGVNIIFGYMGGMITHLADSIYKNSNMKFVQVYHEQTAAIAAEGYARETGKIGVAISTSGPGATNMVTGIANAYFDSIPVIYITGQVNTYEYKYDKPIRQQGFQETDIVSIVEPITKYAKLVDNENEIKYELEKAYHIAMDGRKGPVVLDIPMNIQRANVDLKYLKNFESRSFENTLKESEYEEIIKIIKESKKPLILVGAGLISDNSQDLLKNLIDKTEIPVVTSLMGKGCFPDERKEHMGMIGSYGNRCANMLVPESDLLIALGSRLDTRQTGNILEGFLPKGKIIHVNIDQDELENHRLENRLKINSKVKDFLNQLEKKLDYKVTDKWKEYYSNLKENYNQEKEIKKNIDNKIPYKIMEVLGSYSKNGDIFTADIGQNQMWSAQHLKMKENQRYYTSGGLAPMGYSLPASIGASFGNLSKSVYSINGDGGFHMALQSLMLISQYDLPIKVIILNNNALGMITQFQELYFEKRMVGTTPEGGYLVPEISFLAKAYNLKYFKITKNNIDDKKYLDEVFSIKNGIIEFLIEGETKVYPKLEYNQPINKTSPILIEYREDIS